MTRDSTYRLTPFRVVLIAVVLGICGFGVIPFLSIQLNPPPRSHGLQISYQLPGGTPESIESEITAPLERGLASIEGLVHIESRSTDNSGQILLLFDEKFDIAEKRLETSARIRQLFPQLPEGTSFPQIHYRSEFQAEQRLLTYAISSTMPASRLLDYLTRNLLPDIATQTGISSVNIHGAPAREIHLVLQPQKMKALDLQPREVFSAIHSTLTRRELGKIHKQSTSPNDDMVYLVYGGEGLGRDPLDYLPNLQIGSRNQRTIFIRDVGHLRMDVAPPNQYYRINGLQSVNLSIMAERSANLIRLSEITSDIVHRFETQNESFLQVFESYNAADFLQKELNIITRRSVATMAILLLFIILIYRNIRKVFIILLSLVLTLLAGFIVYYFSGLSLHLYSIAGLTLSLGIILDNILVMSDHVWKKRNREIFMAILAATLTTVGAMAAIFLMEKSQRENLVDFFLIFSINLTLSLATALYLIPAFTSLFHVHQNQPNRSGRKKLLFSINRMHHRYFDFVTRFRWIIPTVFILLFGLPFFLLPTTLEKESKWAKWYNALQEKPIYADHIRPFMDDWLGGTFRLFYNHRDRFYFGSQRREETKLYLHAQMPAGGTLSQLNEVMLRIESFLKTFPQIQQFQLNITSPQRAVIEILFDEEYQHSGFPFQLKDELISFAISAGSADFRVWGVGDAFNNVLPGERVSTHIVLSGYNFDNIWSLARNAKDYLEQHPRIKQVYINSDMNYYIPDNYYYYMEFKDPAFLLQYNIHPGIMASRLESSFRNFGPVARWSYNGEQIPLRVEQAIDREDQMWSFMHAPMELDTAVFYRQEDVFRLIKEKGSSDIVRKNQSYQLVLEYDFIGNHRLGQKVLEESLEQIQSVLPVGYKAESQRNYWSRDSTKTPILWIILAGIIFVWITGSILFNSLRQALVPVIMIPFAFIGIFLVTHYFEFSFGQGGLASFLLVGGLSVNAIFFIVNDYNRIRLKQPLLPTSKAYIKAYNGKIVPILLTALSTVLGLLPFVLFDQNEPFWYSLALCTIGGMIFSVVVVVLMLPVFFRR